MTPEQRQALEAELTELQRKLSKRKDQPGFAANSAQLEARIGEIELLLGNQTD